MKVTVWKTIDVECECDIDADDMIAELAGRIGDDQSDENYWRQMLPALSRLIRIVQSIKDESIVALRPEHVAIIHAHLAKEAERWRDVSLRLTRP